MAEEIKYGELTQSERCDLPSVHRVAAMLDIPAETFENGMPLPRGWHFFLLAGCTKRSSLRADGFPGFGFPMPDTSKSRLVLGGRTVSFSGDIRIGNELVRTSSLESLVDKQTSAGAILIAIVRHQLRQIDEAKPVVVETQKYILLDGRYAGSSAEEGPHSAEARHRKDVTPDETMLFQYSALGFNSHKIHLDRSYARDAEGYPDLVVNGGLTTLLMTEFLRSGFGGEPIEISTRHTAPLFCGRNMSLTADPNETGWRMRALNDRGAIAMEAEVILQ